MNKISQSLVAVVLTTALVFSSGCAITNTAMVATVTASDIKYVIDKYPETTSKIAKIELTESQEEAFEKSLDSLDQSYTYFSNLSPSNVDVNQLVTEYVATRSAYLDLRDVVLDADIEDTRLRSELKRMDDLVTSIDQNINSLLKGDDMLDTESVQTLARTLSTLIKIAL